MTAPKKALVASLLLTIFLALAPPIIDALGREQTLLASLTATILSAAYVWTRRHEDALDGDE